MQLNLEFIRLQNGQILKFKAMTKEEKRLLLQDISARLLYGVIVRLDYGNGTIVTREMGIGSFHDMLFGNTKGKPYLRPMSSITKNEYEEETTLFGWNTGWEHYDWLNAHHFDYRGLIEKGLAIEAPKGMYKIK